MEQIDKGTNDVERGFLIFVVLQSLKTVKMGNEKEMLSYFYLSYLFIYLSRKLSNFYLCITKIVVLSFCLFIMKIVINYDH